MTKVEMNSKDGKRTGASWKGNDDSWGYSGWESRREEVLVLLVVNRRGVYGWM
jgi:hypothetical protein